MELKFLIEKTLRNIHSFTIYDYAQASISYIIVIVIPFNVFFLFVRFNFE